MNSRNLAVPDNRPATLQSIPVPQLTYVEPAMSPWQIGSILWAYRLHSLLIGLAVVFTVGAAAMAWPRTYEATATLMVNFDVYDPLAGREFPVGLIGSYMSTQVELASSTEVLLPVIERLGLERDEEYTAGYEGSPEGLPLWIANGLQKNLTVRQGLYGSQLLYITYAANEPAEAAEIANAVADVYTEQQYQRLTGPAKERARRYTEQLGELQARVTKAQDEATTFRRRHDLIDSDLTGDVSLELLTDLEHRLQEMRQIRRAAEARAAGDQSVGTGVLGSTMIQSLKTQLAAHNAELAKLKESLGNRHPDVVSLRSQIDTTRRALYAEQRAYSGNATAELNSARKLEAQLQAAVDEQRAKVASIREVQDEGAKHWLELESAQSAYKRALEGYDQVLVAATGEYTNVQLVSRATEPTEPSKPKVILMLFLGCIAGGGLGLVVPFGYEMLHRRIRRREDLERDHGIPVLAELGRLGGRETAYAVQYER